MSYRAEVILEITELPRGVAPSIAAATRFAERVLAEREARRPRRAGNYRLVSVTHDPRAHSYYRTIRFVIDYFGPENHHRPRTALQWLASPIAFAQHTMNYVGVVGLRAREVRE